MSFGFGVGDLVAVGNLAWSIYRVCKGLSEEFEEVCREALAVHAVIKELQDEAGDPQSLLNLKGVARMEELMLLIRSLEETLKELDNVVSKYQRSKRPERRICTRLKLATEDLDRLRSKLAFHLAVINAFMSSLSCGSVAKIETVLLQLVSEIQQNRYYPSLASPHETTNVGSVWRELESELAGDGILGPEIAKHKTSIKDFIQDLLRNATEDTASLLEFGRDGTKFESSPYGPNDMNVPIEDLGQLSIRADIGERSFALRESEEDQSADEELPTSENSSFYGSLPPDPTKKREPGPNLNDALAYIDQVIATGKFDRFYQVLQAWQGYVLDNASMIDRVFVLLISYPELLQGFTRFLPPGCWVEYGMVDNHQAFRVVMPFAAYVRIPDIDGMKLSASGNEKQILGPLKWIDPASLDILQRSSKLATEWNSEQNLPRKSRTNSAKPILRGRLRTMLGIDRS